MNEKSLTEVLQIITDKILSLHQARKDALGYMNSKEDFDIQIEYFAQLLGIFSILSKNQQDYDLGKLRIQISANVKNLKLSYGDSKYCQLKQSESWKGALQYSDYLETNKTEVYFREVALYFSKILSVDWETENPDIGKVEFHVIQEVPNTIHYKLSGFIHYKMENDVMLTYAEYLKIGIINHIFDFSEIAYFEPTWNWAFFLRNYMKAKSKNPAVTIYIINGDARLDDGSYAMFTQNGLRLDLNSFEDVITAIKNKVTGW